jgi:hypothetical protein
VNPKRTLLILTCLVFLGRVASAEDSVPAPAEAEERAGALVDFGFTQYFFGNSTPLAYRFGGGYEFPGGLRIATDLDTLFYADERDGVRFSYQLNNWLIEALYSRPLRWHLRVQGGADVDFLFGSQSKIDIPGNIEGFPGFIGLGVLGGLALDLTPHWELSLQGRWTETFTSFPQFPAIDLSASYTW